MVTEERASKIEHVASNRIKGALVLEDIYDMHNAMAAFRSCDAFGIQDVYLIFLQQDEFDPNEVGKTTSSSANKWLDYHVYYSTETCIRDLKDSGYEVVATVLDKDSESLFEADLTHQKIALMLGNENRGLSDTAVALADRKLMIPMNGMVQSLNLSVATAIFLYELRRQREAHGLDDYLVNDQRRKKLIEDFTYR
jgi:tRNA (guanosine-2'-O-)-methyltransferase